MRGGVDGEPVDSVSFVELEHAELMAIQSAGL
jgi:hypothetical protein